MGAGLCLTVSKQTQHSHIIVCEADLYILILDVSQSVSQLVSFTSEKVLALTASSDS